MQLIVTALGEGNSALFEQLLGSVRESDCRVQECRMARLAGMCACFLLVDGKWNHIARLEHLLAALHTEGHLFFQRLTDEPVESATDDLLYVADVLTREHAGVLEDLVGFFLQRSIGIQDLRCSSYCLPYMETMVSTIHMLLRIPTGISALALRDDFLDFCEQMQVDAIFEPVKPVV